MQPSPILFVPEQFIQDGQIVLNIVPHAVHALHMSNDAITFSARFGGVSRDIYVPLNAVIGIYAVKMDKAYSSIQVSMTIIPKVSKML